ncbi:hypothetical protein NGF19_29385 [Streptomyces sp. RY43-2]|uniref:Uncharacterized protein n=1 Tax=Streptomyces macrolidinus TaxID=2952607 RepID=A0ABT0ZMS6_9ACTN|nr:hypothetical protein [Streptomyces macrolidinus]MCN9244845.1 hypothetical protein [Streptomyces macrolidinus]
MSEIESGRCEPSDDGWDSAGGEQPGDKLRAELGEPPPALVRAVAAWPVALLGDAVGSVTNDIPQPEPESAPDPGADSAPRHDGVGGVGMVRGLEDDGTSQRSRVAYAFDDAHLLGEAP